MLKDNKDAVLIGAVIFLVFAVGFFAYSFSGMYLSGNVVDVENDNALKMNDVSTCDNLLNEEAKNVCYILNAYYADKINICNKVSNDEFKKICYEMIAIKRNDIKLCQTIKKQGLDPNECYAMVAVAKKDVNTCNSIKENQLQKDSCIRGVAIKTLNIRLCSRLNNDGNKDYCYNSIAQKTNDVALCGKISQNTYWERTDCYQTIARNKKDTSICNKIIENPNDDYYWWNSKDSCYAHSASKKEDVVLCNNIKNVQEIQCEYNETAYENYNCVNITVEPYYKSRCYINVANGTKNEAICNKINNSYPYSFWQRDNCYLIVAAEKKDEKICVNIVSDSAKTECKTLVAARLLDLKKCSKFDEYYKDVCYYFIAINSKNKDVCSKMSDERINWCYSRIAPIINDVKICELIKNDDETKDYCYIDLARINKNYKLCQKVSDEELKGYCYRRVLREIYRNIYYGMNEPISYSLESETASQVAELESSKINQKESLLTDAENTLEPVESLDAIRNSILKPEHN